MIHWPASMLLDPLWRIHFDELEQKIQGQQSSVNNPLDYWIVVVLCGRVHTSA